MHLLLEPALKDTGKLSTRELRKDNLALLEDEKIAEVIQAAEQARKLVPLYELTRWPSVRGGVGALTGSICCRLICSFEIALWPSHPDHKLSDAWTRASAVPAALDTAHAGEQKAGIQESAAG
jgi:hypothetical protein